MQSPPGTSANDPKPRAEHGDSDISHTPPRFFGPVGPQRLTLPFEHTARSSSSSTTRSDVRKTGEMRPVDRGFERVPPD
jgi:hypothetical protein